MNNNIESNRKKIKNFIINLKTLSEIFSYLLNWCIFEGILLLMTVYSPQEKYFCRIPDCKSLPKKSSNRILNASFTVAIYDLMFKPKKNTTI